MRFWRQSLLIILTVTAVFVWKAFFSDLTVPFLGLLIIIYFFLNSLGSQKGLGHKSLRQEVSVPVLLAVILLLITSTGSLSSGLFFLLYFLLFALVFLFLPETAFVFALACFLFFLPDSLKTDTVNSLLKLSSLLLVSPVAYFFGRIFRMENKEQEELIKAKKAAENIREDVASLIREEGHTLDENGLLRLKDIVDETRRIKES